MLDRHRTSATLGGTCSQVLELAHARLDGELAAADAARLAAHLAGCSRCARAVTLELRFAYAVRARAGRGVMPAATRARLLSRIVARAGERPRAPRGARA